MRPAVVAGVLPDDVPVLADKREAVRAEEAAGPSGGTSRPADVSEVTPLHGPGRTEVAAAS